MKRTSALISLSAIAAGLLCAPPALAQPDAQATAQASKSEAEALHDLFARADAAYLERNPVAAFYRGDFSDAGRLGDFSTASLLAEREAAEANLAALEAIDREALGPDDRIYYDVFEYRQQRTLS